MSAETRLFRQKLASEGLSRQLFEEILAWAEEAPVERLYSDIAGLSARWNALENDLNKNLVPSDHMTVNRDKILDSLLGYLEGLDRQVDKPQYTYRLEARPRCFGRPDQVEELIGCWLQNGRKFILGPGGMGKSNLCLFSLHDERVITRFGDRRYFIRCDGDESRAAVVAELAAALGITMSANAENEVLHELAAAETVLVLDNFETPWGRDILHCEGLLQNLATVPGLSLAVTIRGNMFPPLGWEQPMHIEPVSDATGREIFLSIAGERHASDPTLDQLLVEMDGHPLSISLLAYQAQAENNLNRLYRRWQSKRAELLKRGTGDHKDLNLAASINLSVESPEMQPEGLDLLKILGQLPDGLGEKDLLVLFPETGDHAAANLLQLGFVLENTARLRLLNPVREFIQINFPLKYKRMKKLVEHFLQKAESLGPKIGEDGGKEATLELSLNWGNLLKILDIALEKYSPSIGIDSAVALADFQIFSGLKNLEPLTKALKIAINTVNRKQQADCLRNLGKLTFQFENDIAREYFEKSFNLYECINDLAGQANCLRRLGRLAYRESKNAMAQEYFERALLIYKELEDLLGLANCIRDLGDVASRDAENEIAENHYKEALEIYEIIEDLLGQANCILSLGDLASRKPDYEFGKVCFERALVIYEKIGDITGQANCFHALGNIERFNLKNDEAKKLYNEALLIYRKTGAIFGQANCLRSLGHMSKDANDLLTAKKLYLDALAIYLKIKDVFSIGWTHFYLFQISQNEEQTKHQEAAIQAWEKAGYHRLIKENFSDD